MKVAKAHTQAVIPQICSQSGKQTCHAEAYTHTVDPANEDAYGITCNAAFVLDGASALTECHFTPAENDVVWMVNWWERYLQANLDELEQPLQQIIEKGIIAFNEAFAVYRPVETLSKLEWVSSSLAIVRMQELYLECFVLGDVEISLKLKNGKLEILTDETTKHLDAQVIQLMSQNGDREKLCVFKDFTEDELSLLKENRMKMNTKEGYYILSHDVTAVSKGIYKVYPLEILDSCLLSSDGLSPLDQFYERGALMSKINTIGIKALVEQLRAYEKEDEEKSILKRLKTHDDATAIFLEF